MARDQTKMMGVEENRYEKGDMLTEVIQRYGEKKTYYVRSECK